MTRQLGGFLCYFVQNQQVIAVTAYFSNFHTFSIYDDPVAFRTRIEIQALQAFVFEAHYPSSTTLKINACRRLNSLRISTAVSIAYFIQSACVSVSHS